jgi:hypothetical protein
MKLLLQKRPDGYNEKKAKPSIIMVVQTLKYGKRCSKSTVSNARHHIQLCTCVVEFMIFTLFFAMS